MELVDGSAGTLEDGGDELTLGESAKRRRPVD